MSKFITSRAEYITIIKNGKLVYKKDPLKDDDLNQAGKFIASYVIGCWMDGSGGTGPLNLWSKKKYDIDEFSITSMVRYTKNGGKLVPTQDAHGMDKAVDFYVLPLKYNVRIFNDISKMLSNRRAFLSVPLWTAADRTAHNIKSVPLHVHYDMIAKGKNWKMFEYEQTQINGNLAAVTDANAVKALAAYQVPSSERAELKAALMDMTSGDAIQTSPQYEETIIEKVRDALPAAGDIPGAILKYAVIGLLLYGGYRMIKAGALDGFFGKKKKENA
jgi:hypothetical protein